MKADLIKAFYDATILEDEIVISVVNQRGKDEEGSGSGVYRDVHSTFWQDVYESLMVGEEERIPCIWHDYQRQEWEAIARILVFGYIVTSTSQYVCLKHFSLSVFLGRTCFLERCYLLLFEDTYRKVKDY